MVQIMAPVKKEENEPEPPQKPLLMVPVARNFGEVGTNFKWDPENVLTEKEVLPHLGQSRLWRFGAFRLYIWKEDYRMKAQGMALFHHNTLAYSRKGRFYITGPAAKEKNKPRYTVKGPVPGADIDGDGIPDLLLYKHSGCKSCCWTVLHIECGPRPLLRAEFHTYHSPPVFQDPDGDGRTEVRFLDTFYAYWNDCYAGNPYPSVVLRIQNGHYAMAGKIMWAQRPSARKMAAQTRKLRKWFALYQKIPAQLRLGCGRPEIDRLWEDDPRVMWGVEYVTIPYSVWGVLLDLIYCGRCQEAIAGC